MAIIKEYFDVTTKYINEQGEKTLVLFQVGSFFEVYGLFDQKEKSYSKSNIYDFSIICDKFSHNILKNSTIFIIFNFNRSV